MLVNDLFKSKGSVASYLTDRASVHTGNASEQFLQRNGISILVHTLPEQLLKLSKTHPVQCEHRLIVKKNTKEVFAYLRDKQIKCCIIKRHPTTKLNKLNVASLNVIQQPRTITILSVLRKHLRISRNTLLVLSSQNLNISRNKLYIWNLQITRFKMIYDMFVF